MTRTTVYTIERPQHRVAFLHAPGEIEKGRIRTEWRGHGDYSQSRSAINTGWSAEVTREEPHADDEYPMSMPHTISNLTVYARDSDKGSSGMFTDPEGDYDYTYLDHLYTQPEARGEGYGQLMWDIYTVISVAVGGDARGKIGETDEGASYGFLRSNGVPDEDIEETSGAWVSTDAVKWDTPVENIKAVSPVVESTESGVDI